MNSAHLRFSTDILRRLGEELNQSIDQGILELVKNAYDADAINCGIELINIDKPGGTIRVVDDGDGMDDDHIINGWLVLGKSSKTKDAITRLGRSPSGNKGLGRLASLRIGDQARLITNPRGLPNKQYALDIDWKRFDNTDVVEDVSLVMTERKRPPDEVHGTTIEVSGIHTDINRMEVRRLARGLLLLADPFGDNPTGFLPTLVAPEFKELETLVKGRYFDESQFHLTASVDQSGFAVATVSDSRGNELYTADHSEIKRKRGKNAINERYQCPPAGYDLWLYLLDAKNFNVGSVTIREVREWLSEFGGVHLYVRGLRIAPYGDSGNDWLEMNLSRAKSPELYPSTNTAIGRITVDDMSGMLLPKTDRTGLIDNEPFRQLKQFAKETLGWMQRRRLAERESRREVERTEAPRDVDRTYISLVNTLNDLPSATRTRVETAVSAYKRARNREVTSLKNEVQLYRTMGTVGITAAAFAHETRQPITTIKRNAGIIAERGKTELGPQYEQILGNAVERIIVQSDALQKFASLTLGLINHEKRRVKRIDLHPVIANVLKLFDGVFEDRKISAGSDLTSGNPYLRASEAAIESVLANLITNSIRAFDGYIADQKILIRTSYSSDRVLVIRVLDSGRGIHDILIKDIWLPGETTYPDGTGLGLTIVRDTVRDLGGKVNAVATGELGGAEIVIELPILGA